jgi:hypothetical protein
VLKKVAGEGVNGAHILCQDEPLASLRYLDCFCLELENSKNVSQRATWNFGKATGFL